MLPAKFFFYILLTISSADFFRWFFQKFQAISGIMTAGDIRLNGLTGFSLFWGGLARIDVLKVSIIQLLL